MYVLVRAKDTTTTLSINFSDLWKATKVGAIVGGQTSCKAPELAAFEKRLPADVEILSCHSLHGPQVNPKGQPLV
jgi:prephenate dehydrogenase (NADP+)